MTLQEMETLAERESCMALPVGSSARVCMYHGPCLVEVYHHSNGLQILRIFAKNHLFSEARRVRVFLDRRSCRLFNVCFPATPRTAV